jgi:signal transduction histidine kinase
MPHERVPGTVMGMRDDRPGGQPIVTRPWVVDAALALALTAVALPLLWVVEPHHALVPRFPGPTPATVAVGLALVLPLAWRRRAPVVVLAVIGLAMVAASGLSVPHPGLSILIAVYTVAAEAPRRRAWPALAGFAVLTLVALVMADALRHTATNVLVIGAAWLLGDWRRLHRARTAELERRTLALEHAREQTTRLATSEERERIGGELRDVLAHGITAMVTQAQGAARTLASDSERAAAALLTVEQTGRAALVELRRLVGLLRRADPDAPFAPRSTATAPGPDPAAVSTATPPRDRLRKWVRNLPVAVQDAGLAVVVLATELSVQWVYRPDELGPTTFTGPTLTTLLLASAVAATLVVRRRLPQVTLAATLLGAIAIVALEIPANLWAPLVALYTVAVHRTRRHSLSWLGASVCLASGLMLVHGELGFLPGQLVVLGAAWLLGDRQRIRQAYAAELEERSTQLEQDRAREVALAIAGERARIARELHDIVAHSIGVMVVQAGGARRMVDQDPARARAGIHQVVACGRDSLGRMRAVFRLLGNDQGFAPQPTVDDIGDLVRAFGDAGLAVALTVEGRRRQLSAGVELSTFRIVQESLTNVLRHAGTEHASVRLAYGDDTLEVEITDDGRGPAGGTAVQPDGGHGILGMRERAALVGGDLEIGGRLGGGFRVSAVLPAEPVTDGEPAAVLPVSAAP